MKTVKLSDFIENPNNPQTVTDEAFARLVEKIKRVPDGLTAHRIAYYFDSEIGKNVVIAGNKRLRAVKIIHGENATVPSDWFQDVSKMTTSERTEFIIDSNVSEGKFDASKLMEMFHDDEQSLRRLVDPSYYESLVEAAQSDLAISAGSSAGNGGLLNDIKNSDENFVVLSIQLSTSDYEDVVSYLREINNDISTAFMEVINGLS